MLDSNAMCREPVQVRKLLVFSLAFSVGRVQSGFYLSLWSFICVAQFGCGIDKWPWPNIEIGHTYNHSEVSKMDSCFLFFYYFTHIHIGHPFRPLDQQQQQQQIQKQQKIRRMLNGIVDIDECLTGSNTCRRNQRCINSNGSYRCVNLLTCSGGYTSNDEGTQCIGMVMMCILIRLFSSSLCHRSTGMAGLVASIAFAYRTLLLTKIK